MSYDVDRAIKDGVSEEEIIQHLSKTRNFDPSKYAQAGFSNREIIDHFAPKKSAGAKPGAETKPPTEIQPTAKEKPPVKGLPAEAPVEPGGRIPPTINEPIFKETIKPIVHPVTAGPEDIKSILAEQKRQEAIAPPGMAKPKEIQPQSAVAEIGSETPPPKITPERKEVTPPFAARHPYLAAIPPTIWETAKEAIPFGKYAGEEGRAELRGDFFPPGTTTDPEKLKEIEKELVTGKKKISPYESLAKETMSAAELAAFPTAARVAGAIGEEILPAALTRFLKTPIGPWLRSLTNKERGLVAQSLDDMVAKGYSEGDVLRRWNNPSWREEALKRRNKGEEYPPFEEGGKPAEEPPGPGISPAGMAPEAQEPVGSTIPGVATAPGPATAMGEESQLRLPPGQGFQLVEPKPKTILRPKAPVGTEFKINSVTGEPERVGPPGMGPETPESIGTTIPPSIVCRSTARDTTC